MASCHMLTAWLAPFALLLLASRSLAIPVTISNFGYGSQVLLYGQTQTYTALLTVPAGSPVPQGNLQFQNASATIATASLASATTTGSSLNVTFVDSATADLLPAGLYSAYHAVYPGFNSSTNSWAATDSRSTPLSDGIFQVLQASVALTYKATPFTLANFTSSLLLVATNVNGTNQVPQGMVYEAITNQATGALITNSSLVLTPQDANSLTGKLPASFNATALLAAGTYQATFTYFPSPNFTQPTPLVVVFQIVDNVVPSPPPPAVPPPPPPPGAVPPPRSLTPVPPVGPPVGPPSGALNTTIVLEVFYQEGKKGKLHLDCTGSQLVYTAAVRGPTATQIPTTGSISFLVQPSGITIGSAAVTPDSTLGSAYATIVGPGPTSSVYGQYTVVASYSGSIDGVYLPAKASAVLNLSASCGHKDPLNTLDTLGEGIVSVVDSVTADDIAANNAYQTPVTVPAPDPYGQASFAGK